MSGYAVFQAHDGLAAQELCVELPDIDLLVLNTFGTGIDVGDLVRSVWIIKPGLPVLHIGNTIPVGLPHDVPTLAEDFTPDGLLRAVEGLLAQRLVASGANGKGHVEPRTPVVDPAAHQV